LVKKWEVIALSTAVVGILVFTSFPALVDALLLPKVDNVPTIVMTARISEFGGLDPNEVVVTRGEKVRLLIYTEDVVHGFGLSGYNIMVELHPGEWTEIEFIADKLGEFPFFCTVYCSPLHGLMRGKVRVIPES
jgi:heme/copper-type cytochrome/quinol oxidase subunit 2